MKVAIVHDWLTVYGGAERVLEQIIRLYPDADLFSLIDFLPDENRFFIFHKKVTTSFIQNLPFAKRRYRAFLPIMPLAIEQFDLSEYDLVISSSYAVAKGVITGPDQLHICMCYSPIRYAWDMQHQYLQESGLTHGVKSWVVRWLLHKIRIWDSRTANGVDEFIAISDFIRRRIKKVYRRDSHVIYPPVYLDNFRPSAEKADFYLTASRMVPYKKIDLLVETFSKELKDKTLYVIGDGPEYGKIKSKAGNNVILLGYQSNEVLVDYLQRAKAFLFAPEEDFGIAPLEAQACGTPVIAYGKGGALETIVGLGSNSPTGVFFYEQSIQAIHNAVLLFEEKAQEITAEACVKNAKRFSDERFREEVFSFVERAYSEWDQDTIFKSVR